jgi:hypothetical protein
MMDGKLDEALAKAQAEMTNATLNKINPHFKSKYADLPTIRDATVPVLAKHGLTVTQFTRVRDSALLLVTRLAHTSGESIEGEYPLPYQVDKPQAMGSAMTYARRYGLAAMCGIAAEEDDDGNGAEKIGKVAEAEVPWRGPIPRTTLTAKAREIFREVAACADADQLDAFLASVREEIEQVKIDLPGWWDNADQNALGLKQHIERIRKGFDEPIEDWKISAEDIKKGIDACKNASNLDAYLESIGGDLETIKKNSPTAHDFLTKRADAKRASFTKKAA